MEADLRTEDSEEDVESKRMCGLRWLGAWTGGAIVCLVAVVWVGMNELKKSSAKSAEIFSPKVVLEGTPWGHILPSHRSPALQHFLLHLPYPTATAFVLTRAYAPAWDATANSCTPTPPPHTWDTTPLHLVPAEMYNTCTALNCPSCSTIPTSVLVEYLMASKQQAGLHWKVGGYNGTAYTTYEGSDPGDLVSVEGSKDPPESVEGAVHSNVLNTQVEVFVTEVLGVGGVSLLGLHVPQSELPSEASSAAEYVILVFSLALSLLATCALHVVFRGVADSLGQHAFKLHSVAAMCLDNGVTPIGALSFWLELREVQEGLNTITACVRECLAYLPTTSVPEAVSTTTQSTNNKGPIVFLQLGLFVKPEVAVLHGQLVIHPPFKEEELESLTVLLTTWLQSVSRIAHTCNGFVENVLGEEFMLSFGSTSHMDPKVSLTTACEAALAIQRACFSLQRQSFSSMTTLQFCCGISLGPLICGNSGTEQARYRTATGCVVAVAKNLTRLSCVNKLGVLFADTGYIPTLSSLHFRDVDRLVMTLYGETLTVSVLNVQTSRISDEPVPLDKAWSKVDDGRITDALTIFDAYLVSHPDDYVVRSVMEGIVVYYSRFGDGLPFETVVRELDVKRQPCTEQPDNLLSPMRVTSPTFTQASHMQFRPSLSHSLNTALVPAAANPQDAISSPRGPRVFRLQSTSSNLVMSYVSYLVLRRGHTSCIDVNEISGGELRVLFASFFENTNMYQGTISMSGDQLAAWWSCESSKTNALRTALAVRKTVSVTDGTMGLAYDRAYEGVFDEAGYSASCLVGDVITKAEALAGMAMQCDMSILAEAVFRDVVPDVWWRFLCPEGVVLQPRSEPLVLVEGIVELDVSKKTDKYYTLGMNAFAVKDFSRAKGMFQNSLDIAHDSWTLEVHSAVSECLYCKAKGVRVELSRSGDYFVVCEAGVAEEKTNSMYRMQSKRQSKMSLRKEDAFVRTGSQDQLDQFAQEQQLVVIIDSGEDLSVADLTSSDPYVEVVFNGQMQRTTTVFGSRCPVWSGNFNGAEWRGLMFVFPLRPGAGNIHIHLTVYDEDLLGSNDFMGEGKLTLTSETVDSVIRDYDLMLYSREGRGGLGDLGLLRVRVVAGPCKDVAAALEDISPPPLLSFGWMGSREIVQANLAIERPGVNAEQMAVGGRDLSSVQRKAWKLLRALVLLYNCARIPSRVVFSTVSTETESGATFALFCLDYCFDMVYWIELWNTFRRPYIDQGQRVVDPVAIASHYLHNWFAVDLVACFPWELVWAIWEPTIILERKWLRVNRCLNLVRFRSLVAELVEDVAYEHPVLIEILVFLLLLMYYLLWMGCFWGLVFGKLEDDGSEVISNYLYNIGCTGTTLNWEQLEVMEKVVVAFHWALRAFSGYGSGWPGSDAQHIMLLLVNVTGVAVFASVIAYVQKLVSVMGTMSRSHFHKLEEISETMKYLKLEGEFCNEVLRYYRSLYSRTKQAEQGQFAFLANELPETLWRELTFHINKYIVKAVPELRSSNIPFITAIVSRLRERFEAPGNILIERGDIETDGLYFIARGSASATLNGKEVERLGPGDFWGEVSIILGGPQIATVEILEYTEVFFLPYEDAGRLLSSPEADSIRARAIKRRDRVRFLALRNSLVDSEISPPSMAELTSILDNPPEDRGLYMVK